MLDMFYMMSSGKAADLVGQAGSGRAGPVSPQGPWYQSEAAPEGSVEYALVAAL